MNKTERPVFSLGETLTDGQLAYFRTHGIIQFRNFIDKDTVVQFIGEVERVQKNLLDNDVKKVNGIPLKFGRDVNEAPLIQRIAFASHYSKLLAGILKDPR